MLGAADLAFPIVVGSDDGLVLFGSVESLRGYIEIPDVEAGVYGPAFDAEGRLLAIELPEELHEAPPTSALAWLRWRVAPGFNPVRVRVVDKEPRHRDELKRLLRSATGTGDLQADLSELLDAAHQRFGMTGE